MALAPQIINSLPLTVNQSAFQEAVRFLRFFHRAPNARVALAQKIIEAGRVRLLPLGNVAMENCEADLSAVWPHVKADCYWTLNSISDEARSFQRSVANLPVTRRRVEQIKWLNGAWVDLDCYKKQLAPEQAYSQAIAYLQEHGLPLPEVSLFSGMGVWLFWRFIKPIRAGWGNRDLLLRINTNLVSRLEYLGADSKSRDIARICRVAGSINSKTDNQVYFREIPYGLPVGIEDFASILQIPPRKTYLPGETKRHRDLRNPAKVRAGYARWQTRRADLLQVFEYRKVIAKGHRRETVFAFAAVSKRAGVNADDICRECYELGHQRCRPPLPDALIESALSQGLAATRNFSDATLRRMVAITQEECDFLKLNVGRLKRKPRSKPKAAEIADRRRVITELWKIAPLSCQKTAELLVSRGIKVSREIVRRDYLALGFSQKS